MDFKDEIIKQKEFVISRVDTIKENEKPTSYIDKLMLDNNILNLHSYQNFIKSFINPNNINFNRLLMIHQVGSGKTISALSVAKEYIKYYQINKSINDKVIGSVIILGFTKSIFKRELMSHSEFGIVSQKEIDEMTKVKEFTKNNLSVDANKLKELKKKYTKRMSDTDRNGFYKFYGYKELFNKLLISDNVKILNMEFIDIVKNIKKGDIKINKFLLASFKNSLIICDECNEFI